jgi:hypothetical protein
MLKNCTPHPIHLLLGVNTRVTIPSAVQSARVEVSRTKIADLSLAALGVEHNATIYRAAYGQVSGLPPAEEGLFLVVSRMVAEASPHRTDLLVPEDTVRDEEGNIVGCRGFAVFSPNAVARWKAT